MFRPYAGQPFDARCLSWQLDDAVRDGTVSIWTITGRLKNVRVTGSPAHIAVLRSHPIGETDLHRDGVWLLHAAIEIPEGEFRRSRDRIYRRRPGHRQHRNDL